MPHNAFSKLPDPMSAFHAAELRVDWGYTFGLCTIWASALGMFALCAYGVVEFIKAVWL